MPLVKMLAMCGKAAPVVVSICECTGHMVGGGNIDDEFIMEYFSNKVDEFDPKGSINDCFFFYRVANVQKADAILCS